MLQLVGVVVWRVACGLCARVYVRVQHDKGLPPSHPSLALGGARLRTFRLGIYNMYVCVRLIQNNMNVKLSIQLALWSAL